MLTEKGGIRCDLTVTRLGPERFWIVSGGGTRPLDFTWLKRHLNGRVQVQDVSSAYAAIGLWGPQARAIAQSISGDDLSHAAFDVGLGAGAFGRVETVLAMIMSPARE